MSPHPVVQAFIEMQAAQCGYCMNGMIIGTIALLSKIPNPTDEQIRQSLMHYLCRCGTHLEIMQAVKLAAKLMSNPNSAINTLTNKKLKDCAS
jgi:nicotinate dehydrogenase subunit A